MDVRIVAGQPTPEEAQVIERAFSQLAAEAKAAVANDRTARRDAWTLSGRLAAHGAGGWLQGLR